MNLKRLTPIVLLLVLATLLVSACGPKTPPPPPPTPTSSGNAAAGKTKFDGTCVTCHGPDAKGLPNLGKDLTTSQWVKSKSDAELVAFFLVGRPATDPLNTTKVDMPPKGGNPALTEKDLLDIAAYIRSLQQ